MHEGGCTCGAVRYRLKGAPMFVHCCHCHLCQIQTGTAFVLNGLIEAEPVAQLCLHAIRDETFLVLPHPEVLTYMRRKTDDYDRWIKGMQRLNRKFTATGD